jgi:four helix bundle protein
MKNYRELKVWKNGVEIVKMTYHFVKLIPAGEKFGIISQMTRAAVSIPANIAEGSSRNSDKDYVRFLQIALGSAFELQTYFIIATEMKWAKESEVNEVQKLLEEEVKMIQAFIRKIANSQQPSAKSN